MPLSRNEIRKRAIAFVHEWRDASDEDAQAKTFWYEFFEVFGLKPQRIGTFETHVKKLNKADGYIDFFWPRTLLIEHKSKGKDLNKAFIQANDYLHGVKDDELPRYLMVSDFANFRLREQATGKETHLALADLPEHIELFDFIAGYEVRPPRPQDPVNLKAAALMGQLHDELKANGYEGHALEVYLVRLLFIHFADDTGIFEQDAFYNWILDHTREDGSDLGAQMAQLFQVLNTPDDKRQKNLHEGFSDFKYINGKLFEEVLPLASWDGGMRVTLLECAGLNWSLISPAIFGALFQSVMNPEQRRNLGAHYTSEQNILKLIKPLFLDDLWAEFDKVKGDKNKLNKFHDKLAELRFLDPACGCGNFLVITYRELRELEIEVIKALKKGQQVVDVDTLVLLNVDRFYGIELEEFPAQIAQVAMWLVDHQMNMRVSAAFGEYMVRIPLRKSATIHCGNALRTDWQSLLPAGERYRYILGNPPFIGSKLMTADMREDIMRIFKGVRSAGILDYVCGWYGLAAQYMYQDDIDQGPSKWTKTAFVSTNSITQGEQVGALWGPLLDHGIKLDFAHQTFRWNNEAKGVAAVHCVIIGFADFFVVDDKRLFEYESVKSEPVEVKARNINPYLIDADDIVLMSRSKPLCPVPEIGIGDKPIDGGHYLFTPEERDVFIALEPGSKKYFRRWLGSDEFINGYERWCLWLGDADPSELKKMPEVMKRIQAVRQVRLESKSAPTQKLADTPTRFHVENMPKGNYLLIPKVSSERRAFIPIGFMAPSTLGSDLVFIVPKASLYHFGMLTSTMHNAWVRRVCGRLESRYRYSKDIVYNNYPWPQSPTAAQMKAVEEAAQGVLDARKEFPGSSLADLYDPLTMPPALLKAHQVLDRAVDKCYRAQPFANDTKRVEYLFELYGQYTAGLFTEEKKKRKKA